MRRETVNKYGWDEHRLIIFEADPGGPAEPISIIDGFVAPEKHGQEIHIALAYEGTMLRREQVAELVASLSEWLALTDASTTT